MVGMLNDEANTKLSGESTRLPATPDELVLERLPEEIPGHRPLEIEFGTGKARFLIESARAHPDRFFAGIERSLAYYRVARDRVRRAALTNVAVYRAEARLFAQWLPLESVSAFHAYFLDPWPKKKQRKRRLLDAEFLALLARKARPGAVLRIVTDHPEYAEVIGESIREIVRNGTPWEPRPWESEPAPPPTHYEIKYREADRDFARFLLKKSPHPRPPAAPSPAGEGAGG
jgi:tRNA (guanine-N7-)-methyltransferase